MTHASDPPGGRRSGPALEHMYQFVKWLVPTLERFPRSQKFLLGDRMQAAALEALEGLTEATYSKAPGAILGHVNIALDRLRLLCRLAFDLHYLDPRRYEFAARALEEIGRLHMVKLRISGDGGHLFQRIADSISDDRGHRFRLIADSVSA